MARPSVVPTWATDTILSGGPQAGIASRLQPSDGLRAQGIYMGRRFPARMISWMLGTTGDWLAHLIPRVDHGAMAFSRTDLAVGTSRLTQLTAVAQPGAVGTASSRQRSILASGKTSGNFPSFQFMNDGSSPANLIDYVSGVKPWSAPASDGAGTLFWGDSSGAVLQSTDAGVTTSALTIPSISGIPIWVGMTVASYLVFAAGSKLFRSNSLGSGWTNSTLAAITSLQDMATDGAGTWVILGNSGTVPFVYTSTNDGVSWTPYGSIGSTATASLCYSAQDGLFYILTTQGKLWSSANGTSWTNTRTMTNLATAVPGFTGGQNQFAACGPVLACIVNRAANSIGRYPSGIAWTVDAGATWFETWISNASGSSQITNLIAANGRLIAVDGVALYRSGVLEARPTLYAGV